MLRLVIGAALALAMLTWSNAQCMQMPTGFSLLSSSVFAANWTRRNQADVAIAAVLAVGR